MRSWSFTTEQVIQLLPYAGTGQTVSSVQITTLPSLGTLYQTSINFETFGYAPTRTVQITTVPTTVTSVTHRVVYVAPPNFASTNFSYQVTDSTAGTTRSHPLLLTAPDKVTVTSQFWTDNEWWTVQTAGTRSFKQRGLYLQYLLLVSSCFCLVSYISSVTGECGLSAILISFCVLICGNWHVICLTVKPSEHQCHMECHQYW
jgi:hypothetical protein